MSFKKRDRPNPKYNVKYRVVYFGGREDIGHFTSDSKGKFHFWPDSKMEIFPGEIKYYGWPLTRDQFEFYPLEPFDVL